MTKTELEKRLGTTQETAQQLEQETKQLTSRLEYVRAELIKQLGKIELLSDMLSELEKPPTEGENGEAEKDADKNDNG
jgi:septal ring factor EnvC (AmiA/AmiB activator)